MKKIRIEIDCGDTLCGVCEQLEVEVGYLHCRAFETFLEVDERGRPKRAKECTDAEFDNNKPGADATGKEGE